MCYATCLGHVTDRLRFPVILFGTFLIDLNAFTFGLHFLNQVFATNELQVANTFVLVAVLRAVLRIDILPGINLHFELMVTTFKSTVHHHGDHLGVGVFESLVFDVDVFGLGPLPDTIPILPVFRAILGNVDSEKDLTASGILTFFLP